MWELQKILMNLIFLWHYNRCVLFAWFLQSYVHIGLYMVKVIANILYTHLYIDCYTNRESDNCLMCYAFRFNTLYVVCVKILYIIIILFAMSFLQVYEAVMSWVHHNLPSRQCHVEQLLENVRLPLMCQDYIVQKVEEEPLVKANSRCILLVCVSTAFLHVWLALLVA